MKLPLRLILFGLAATLVSGLLFAAFGRGAVTWLLEVATADQQSSGIERWRVEGIYQELAVSLFYRAVFLGWSLIGFVIVFSKLHQKGGGSARLAKLSFSVYCFLFFYLALELLAAPFLITHLDLYNYFFVLDVDHRLPASHAGIGTNRDSFRNSREREDFLPEDFNILFLGDSFTFGLGVTREEAFPAKVELRLRETSPQRQARAVNLGWTSASPLLALRAVEELGEAYSPDFLVYCLDMTDFHDDIKYRNMIEKRGIYWFYDKVPLTLKLLEDTAKPLFEALYYRSNSNLPRERFFMSEAPLEETRAYLETALEHVRQLAAWARQRDLGFALVVLPRSYQYSARECPENREMEYYSVLGPYSLEPFRYFDSIAPGEPYPVLSLLETFRSTEVFPTCFRDDPHWNVAGHQIAADAIANFLAPRIESLP
ncbi:MAG: hypothetical protein K0U98_22185 [Deltaproteobacteria bacterium]|nr:hypothetical protein [Deltaproteobacteria bacterium]